MIGALVLLWLVMSRTGWDSLSVATRTEAQDRFSQEASTIAGKPVRVRCDESGEYVGAVQHADGVATVGGDLTYLTPERCLDLYRLAFDGEVTGSQTGRALAVLAHEAWHLRGVRNEGTAECFAFQSGVALGQRLGLSEEAAGRLMSQQLAENAGRKRRGRRVPGPAGLPQRRHARPRPGELALPLAPTCAERPKSSPRGADIHPERTGSTVILGGSRSLPR